MSVHRGAVRPEQDGTYASIVSYVYKAPVGQNRYCCIGTSCTALHQLLLNLIWMRRARIARSRSASINVSVINAHSREPKRPVG